MLPWFHFQRPRKEFPLTWAARNLLFLFSVSADYPMTEQNMFSVIRVEPGITLHVLTHLSGQLTLKEDGDAANAKEIPLCVHYKAMQTCFNLSHP